MFLPRSFYHVMLHSFRCESEVYVNMFGCMLQTKRCHRYTIILRKYLFVFLHAKPANLLSKENSVSNKKAWAMPFISATQLQRQLYNQSSWPQLPPLCNRRREDDEKWTIIEKGSCWFRKLVSFPCLVVLTGAAPVSSPWLDPKTQHFHLLTHSAAAAAVRTAFSMTLLGNRTSSFRAQPVCEVSG